MDYLVHLHRAGEEAARPDDQHGEERDMAGEDLPFDPKAATGTPLHPKLRDNISTDEITPAYICYYFDETLGEFPYLGTPHANPPPPPPAPES